MKQLHFCSWIALLFILLHAASVFSEDKQSTFFHDDETGFTFPEQIGSFACVGSKRFSHRDLGFGIALSLPDISAAVHLYVYDMGEKVIPSDTTSKVILQHFAKNKADIIGNVQRGDWKTAKHISDDTIPITKDKDTLTFLRATYLVEISNKQKSCIYLGATQNKFIKIRATYLQSDAVTFEKELTRFLKELVVVLHSK